jgi:N-acetylglucosamine-6-phosphate deacetylase
MTRIRARHYATDATIQLTIADGKIERIDPIVLWRADPTLPYVAPFFFDLQINGGGGHSFTSDALTVDDIRAVVAQCRRHGIGQFCPTLITSSFETLRYGMATLRQAIETDAALAHALPCIHLEGPYLSAEDGPRGAHPREHVRSPDWDEFRRLQDAAGGRIRLHTLAPEHEGALAFIEKVVQSGVVVALGHTAAAPARIRDAVKAGARLSTHLGNGCTAMLPRHDNVIWTQLACDELWASLICDGQHLPPSMVKCLVRAKTPRRIILTCDASSLAGLPPGRYRQWGQELEVLPEGKIVVVGQNVLAGSWAFTDLCVGNVMRFAGVSLGEAVAMVSDHPRELLGLPPQRLEVGAPADLVLFAMDEAGQVHVRETIVDGSQKAGVERAG